MNDFGYFESLMENFKKVNDTYGHEAGDKVLVYVANQIRSQIRENDAIIRLQHPLIVM